MPSFELSVVGRQSAHHQELGRFVTLLTKSPGHSNLPFDFLSNVVEPAMRHRQYELIFDERGNPLSFVVWAFLAQDCHVRAVQGQPWNLHISEWNEGDYLWIVDLFCPNGYLRDVLRLLRDRHNLKNREIYYRRVRGSQLITKVIVL